MEKRGKIFYIILFSMTIIGFLTLTLVFNQGKSDAKQINVLEKVK